MVLVSPESKSREWINFEAGFGEGNDSLVIPVAMNNMSFGQLSYPMAGIQGRNIEELGRILDDISNRLGLKAELLDHIAYKEELEEASAKMTYKHIKVEPAFWQGNLLSFDIQNVGNVDMELLMLEVYVPMHLLSEHYPVGHYGIDIDSNPIQRNGVAYHRISCYSGRGVYGDVKPILRPVITPSMGKVRPNSFRIPLRKGLTAEQQSQSIFFQIHVIGYRTEEEERKISSIL